MNIHFVSLIVSELRFTLLWARTKFEHTSVTLVQMEFAKLLNNLSGKRICHSVVLISTTDWRSNFANRCC